MTGRLATGLCLISCFTRSAYAPSKDRTVLFDTATLLKRLNVERARDRSPSPAASFARRDGSVQLLRARSKGSSVLCLFFGVGERGSLFVVYRAYPRRWLASRRKGGGRKYCLICYREIRADGVNGQVHRSVASFASRYIRRVRPNILCRVRSRNGFRELLVVRGPK